MKKVFTSSVEEDVSKDFKANCAKDGVPMNKILECMMRLYNSGKIKVEIIEYLNSMDGK